MLPCYSAAAVSRQFWQEVYQIAESLFYGYRARLLLTGHQKQGDVIKTLFDWWPFREFMYNGNSQKDIE